MRGGALVGVAVVSEAALVAIAVGVGALVGVAPLRTAAASVSDALLGAAAGLAPAAGVVLALHRGWAWAHRLLDGLGEGLTALLGLAPWQLVLVAVAAGCGEEVLFRGLVQDAVRLGLEGHAGATGAAVAGIVAGAALFGIAHPVSRAYVLWAGGFGVWLGWCYLRAGNLLLPAVAHAVYDAAVLLYLKRTRCGPDDGAAVYSA
jgi:membrane protease YdiL (CAAX protease family)